jgi:cytochrome c-type protein NapB
VSDPLANAPARVLGLLIAIVVAVVAIGFSTGTSTTSYRAERPPLRERPDSVVIPPARTHAELERHPWTSGSAASGWERSQAIAAREADGAEAESESIDSQRSERAARRAFDGAPPVIPHPIGSSGAADCLACHADGFVLGNRRASPIPHEAYASCTQCHVRISAPFTRVAGNAAAEVPSSWTGLRSPGAGEEAYTGAPPAVPHSTRMRERCESCHGAGGAAPLRTPHPERRSCLQCHPATGSRSERASR